MITQNQYSVLRQSVRKLHIKLDLLNESDSIVGSFQGIVIDGGINLSSDSTYRRSGNMNMVFNKKYNILPGPSSQIWFNKRCRISVGINDYFNNIIWFKLGRFAIDEVDLNLNTAEKTLSCQLKDYMAFLDGTLGGKLSHQTVIPEGTPISEAIKSLVAGLGRFSIEDIRINGELATLPYSIEKPAGATIYEIIKEIMELYMGWDFYFDENGYFIVEKIRDKKEDPIIEEFDGTEKDFTLNSIHKMDFKNVKNSIWVWGRQLDNGIQVKWVYRNRWARNNYSDLSNLSDRQKGDICHITSENNSYMWNGSNWDLLEFKVIPIFNIESIGEKIHTYDSNQLYTETQAKLRCEYELKEKSNMLEKINFDIIPLYYLKPYNKISINDNGIAQGDYLITDLNIPLDISSPMSINAKKIYF